jgi:endonuclease YncB( thermonuclease family)
MVGRRQKIESLLLGLVVLVILGYTRCSAPSQRVDSPSGNPPDASVAGPQLPSPRRCVRVIDGDTIELEGGERVRLIGVNTPESVDPRRPVERFGKEAAAFTRRLAEGKFVRLEYDEESRDQYGRTLAYIYLPNGTLLNAEIIRQGYGFAYTRFPYRRTQEFVALEREAREQRRGLWRP